MRHLSLIFISLFCLACSKYDDTAIWDELNEHEQRLQELERVCKELNAECAALQSVVAALQNNDYVTGVTPIVEDGKTVGYTIHFAQGGSVNIYHGKDGADGVPGADGASGADGVDGKDGYTPVIGIAEYSDGRYYWTIDGEWMMDADGNMLPATGEDGADGSDGEDGADGADGIPGADGDDGADGADGDDGVTPMLKIEDGYWYVSYDEGASWELLYQAATEDGKDGRSFFQGVDVSDPYFIIITLMNGEQIKLPTEKAFQELQTLVNKLNSNLSGMQEIAEALLGNDHVTDIRPVMENGVEVGYTIWFQYGLPITIYHGKDGADGEDGSDGVDAADGHVPVIGMAEDADGNFYWTIDGEWLYDNNGDKVLAVGKGGKDGYVPELKIDAGYWYVSYDGRSWTMLGPVQGTSGPLGVVSVTYDNDHVYITMSNGDEMTLPRLKNDLASRLSLDPVVVKGNVVTFSGRLDVAHEDLSWSGVTVYYSQDTENFNIHTAASVNASLSDGTFRLSLFDMKYDASYNFCIHVKVKADEYYSEVCELRTEVFGTGKEIHLDYENGAFTGSGYFYQTVTASIINGFGVPVQKIHVPERIDGLQFYIRGIEAGVQPLTAYIGYMTDSAKIGTLKIIKSLTNDVYLTKSYAKVILPIEIDRDELNEIPEDGIVYVGFYPPEGHARKPVGIGYISKSEQSDIDTEGHKGVYSYTNVSSGRYVWAVSSSKTPRYAGFIVLL